MNMALLIGLWRAISKPKDGGMWKRIERTGPGATPRSPPSPWSARRPRPASRSPKPPEGLHGPGPPQPRYC